jgi:hypothetical protein
MGTPTSNNNVIYYRCNNNIIHDDHVIHFFCVSSNMVMLEMHIYILRIDLPAATDLSEQHGFAPNIKRKTIL